MANCIFTVAMWQLPDTEVVNICINNICQWYQRKKFEPILVLKGTIEDQYTLSFEPPDIIWNTLGWKKGLSYIKSSFW